MPTPLPVQVVDAFADQAFSGNPAAVCYLTHPAPAQWMQQVAAEMNLSETAFLLREGDEFRLRWFTPLAEVKLCGHATLASAHVLWSEGHLPEEQPARFKTLSGPLVAEKRGEQIQLDFPRRPIAPLDHPPLAELAAALQVRPSAGWETDEDWVVLLENERFVQELQPDFARVSQLAARGLIVTAMGGSTGFDFVSRFFVPKLGINEDPVTGSAHCSLAPFWADRLGKQHFRAWQASRRGGVLEVRLMGDRVLLLGRALTTLRGQLLV
ncbi:MAG: PhzF family phenazine biosynthesis protein [Planctomycetota bacterium]